jgi:hypothetical protein
MVLSCAESTTLQVVLRRSNSELSASSRANKRLGPSVGGRGLGEIVWQLAGCDRQETVRNTQHRPCLHVDYNLFHAV